MIRITLEFPTYSAAASALARIDGIIAPEDRPDAGKPVTVVAGTPEPAHVVTGVPTLDPVTVFAGTAVTAALVPAAVPPAPGAVHSTAAAAAPVTAPVAPPAISAQPPSVPAPPAANTVSVAAAPVAPAGLTPPVTAVDSTGLPWDGRIHAESRGTVADGSWRKRRNVDPATVTEIERQLRAAMAYVPPGSAVPAPPVAAAVPVPLAPPVPAPPAAEPPAPPAPPAAPTPLNFGDLAHKFEAAMVSRALTTEQINAACRVAGLETFNQLIFAPAAIGIVDAELSRVLGVAEGRPV